MYNHFSCIVFIQQVNFISCMCQQPIILHPERNSLFFNISLLMAGLYSFVYLYRPLFSLLLILIGIVFLFHIPMSYETNQEKNGMGTKMFITIYIPNSFIVNIPTAAPLVISYLVSFPVDALHIFFRVFLLHLFLVIFFLMVCQEQRFCTILTGTFL